MANPLISSAVAPSNIALIKYMGKTDISENLPENPSISLTLDKLCSVAEISVGEGTETRWLPELPRDSLGIAGLQVPILSAEGMARIIRHANRVRDALPTIFREFSMPLSGVAGAGWELRTANTFPPASGIASSASAFAAVTLAIAAASAGDRAAFEREWKRPGLRRALARVSRAGSGSSCRSFEGPWVLWEDQNAAALETAMPEVAHFVILVSCEPKRISSSDAHRLVRSSPLWDGRVERVSERARNLEADLGEGDWQNIARTAWTESWEMHSLFHTCAQPFSYWHGGTMDALQWLAPRIELAGAPIVTMDAGPNVHVIVPKSQREEWRKKLREKFGEKVILEDQQGTGARPVFHGA